LGCLYAFLGLLWWGFHEAVKDQGTTIFWVFLAVFGAFLLALIALVAAGEINRAKRRSARYWSIE